MQVPQTNYGSPFRFTRASHGVFRSRDLKKTEEFYTEVLGLVASYSDKEFPLPARPRGKGPS